MNIRICLLSSALMLLPHADATAASTSSSYSDDTELFIYDFAKAGDFRPKVLFVFDNSGSMNTSTMMAKGIMTRSSHTQNLHQMMMAEMTIYISRREGHRRQS